MQSQSYQVLVQPYNSYIKGTLVAPTVVSEGTVASKGAIASEGTNE